MNERTCRYCGRALTARQQIHCSKTCTLREANNRAKRPTRVDCTVCGKVMTLQPAIAKYTKTCGGECRRIHASRVAKGKRTGRDNANWRNGIGRYQAQRGPVCERCGGTRFLCVHHRDHNRQHNEDENLETLCRRCHTRHHASPPPPTGAALIAVLRARACVWCDTRFQPGGPRSRYCSQACLKAAGKHRRNVA